MKRRDFLKRAGAGMAVAAMPGLSLARTDTDARFVLVILRGAVDGLAMCAPYGDRNYAGLRGELALDGSSLGKLDGIFGLHPAFKTLHQSYEQREALVVHAVASPYRERSHFDGQDVLENGGANVGRLRDGWLNRALVPLGGSLGNETAIAMAQNTPLVLRGDASVTSWAPSQLPDTSDSTIDRLADLYADDEFFAIRLQQALKSQSIADSVDGMNEQRRRPNDAQFVRTMMSSTANFLKADDGPRIAVVEAGGWDTHANQGAATGQLANRFTALDAGLDELKRQLGDAWSNTVVAVVTEFGRTARVNGTRGTDHGTATAAVLVGGAINGGKVVSDWPGLRNGDLYEGRDLAATTDLRSVFKTILTEHLDVDAAYVEREVFPDSSSARALDGLILT
ncbi:MAG: DUF1501 domain-containing protein [Woeseiaceae bacterium]|nr:DUF1501 domain-containing protein [Woeseiaceae bacterium]